MKKILSVFTIFACTTLCAIANDTEPTLADKIQTARNACSGISEQMNDMKKMVGINTAVTGVGTVAGAAGLTAGIQQQQEIDSFKYIDDRINSFINDLDNKKKQIPNDINRCMNYICQIVEQNTDTDKDRYKLIVLDRYKLSADEAKSLSPIWDYDNMKLYNPYDDVTYEYERDACDTYGRLLDFIQKQQPKLKQQVTDLATTHIKKLDTTRTSTLAGSALADTAGAIIATKNHISQDLQQRIDNCIAAINDLGDMRLRARAENTATPEELATAQVIEIMCADWKNVDLSSIDKRATGAAISSGTGAALAAAGAVTSSQHKFTGEVTDKETTLNTASNVLAGGATVASAVATVFNATQISAIKKAVAVADKCEEGLNQTQKAE